MPTTPSTKKYSPALCVMVAGVTAGALAAATAAASTSSTSIGYRGLARLGGAPLDGERVMRFSIFDGVPSVEEAPAYCEEQTVTLREGRFAVEIGTGLALDECSGDFADLVRSQRSLFVRIEVRQGEDSILLNGAQPLRSQAFAQSAVGHLGTVPVGSVINWYRPSLDFPFPDGFVLADGSILDDPESPLHEQALPDLIDRFARGVASASEQTGGGATTHTHAVPLASHTHRFSRPGHTHSFSERHDHRNTSVSGTHDHAIPTRSVRNDNGGRDPIGIVPSRTESSGSHSHSVNERTSSGTTQASPTQDGTSSPNAAETLSSDPASNTPRYFGLLKLIRVK